MPPAFPSSERPRARTPRTTNPRSNAGQTSPAALTRDQYWVNHRPTLKSITWATVTVHLPILPPPTETTEIKHTIFTSYTQRLQEAEGDWSDKTNLFVSAFEHLVPAASLEADVVLENFDDYTSNVFDFEAYECYNSMYEVVQLGNDQNFAQEERAVIRWFKFALTIAPQETNVGHLDVNPALFPTPRTHTVFIRALLNNNGNLHHALTKHVLRTRTSTLKTVYATYNQTFEPSIKASDSSYADPSRFERILKQIKAETKFHAVKQIITPVYVGRLDGLRSLTNRILAVQQSYYDPLTRLRRFSTITEFNQKMQALLQEIDRNNPPADMPDLARTFFQGLHENIQHKIIDHLPAGTPNTLNENLRRYNNLVRRATEAEDDQKRVAKTIHQMTRNLQPSRPPTRSQGRPSGPRVFFAAESTEDDQHARTFTTHPNHTTSPTDANQWTHTPAGTRFLLPRCFCASHTGNTIAEDMIAASVEMVETLNEDSVDGFTGVSIVEQALRNASGVRRPIKCFGCQGLPKYDSNAYHLWKDCPNKADQAVWRNFQVNLKRFREEKMRRREERQNDHQPDYYGPPAATDMQRSREPTSLMGWQRQGFPSRAMSETIEAIADKETKPTIRRALLATLKKELLSTELMESDVETETVEQKPKSKPRKKGRLFLLYMKSTSNTERQTTSNETTAIRQPPARTMLAASQGKYPLRIAYTLPHLRFPIGDGETANDRAFITGLLDTGGCCMMGKLEWYKELHRVCPQLFEELFELSDRRYENINIGGLKDGIWLTHVAVLWIPYTEKGATMRIEIGLSDELPVDTLFGVNFQQATKMTIDLGNNKATSAYLGDTYEIVWRTPSNSDLDQIQHEAQKSPMAFTTAYDDDDDDNPTNNQL